MRVSVREEEFDVSAELKALSSDDTGALVSFVGQVRQNKQGPKLLSMTLEHYPGMTEAQIAHFIMDYLKTDAPFGKAEETEAGTIWVDARNADETAKARWQT